MGGLDDYVESCEGKVEALKQQLEQDRMYWYEMTQKTPEI